MRARDWRNVIIGIVAGVAGAKAAPTVAKAMRPAMRTLTAGVIDLTLQGRAAIARMKEDVANMVAEAQYENSLTKQPAAEIKADPLNRDFPDEQSG